MSEHYVQSKRISPGISISLKDTNNFLAPHKFGLYLGEDSESGKALIPTYVDGYSIVNVKDLDYSYYSQSGRFNVRETYRGNDKNISGFKYIFFDVVNGVDINELIVEVRMIDGVWRITSSSSIPSWVV